MASLDTGMVRVLEATGYQTIATWNLGGAPHHAVPHSSTSRVYITNYFTNNLTVYQEPSVSAFVYDGDGIRVKKIEGGQTVVYPNRYYEKNVTTGVVTTYYYHGDRLVALRKGTTLEYVHQDHLDGTAVTTSSTGAQVAALRYYSFGGLRGSSGTLGTDKKYTGQRLDGTGLYFYNARYYDAEIGFLHLLQPTMLQWFRHDHDCTGYCRQVAGHAYSARRVHYARGGRRGAVRGQGGYPA